MTAKTACFKIFLLNIIARFLVLHDLGLTKLFLIFFDQNDLYLTFKFKMVTINTQIKAIFMHVDYNIINNICLMEI